MGAWAYPTQSAASWDMAPAPTREIQQRWYQWALAFVYIFIKNIYQKAIETPALSKAP